MKREAESQFLERMQRVESLIAQIERSPDDETRSAARHMVAALMELHARALEQVLQVLVTDENLRDRCAADDLIAGVLLLHDLHPWPFERRVAHALAKVRPAIEHRGGQVTLVAASESLVHIHADPGGGCGCDSTSAELKRVIENTVRDLAPEVEQIRIDGLEASASNGYVSLTVGGDR